MVRYFDNLSIRYKLVLLISGAVFGLSICVLAIVWVQSRSEVRSIVKVELDAGRDGFLGTERYRIRDHANSAWTASLSARAYRLVQSADQKGTCDYASRLLNARLDDPDDSAHFDFVAFQRPDGRPLAIGVRGHPTCDSQIMNWRLPDLSEALAKHSEMIIWESPERRVYHIYAAPVKMSGADSHDVLGTAALGFEQNDETAFCARQRAHTDVVYWHVEETGKVHLIFLSNPALGPVLEQVLPQYTDVRSPFEFRQGKTTYALEQVPFEAPGVTVLNLAQTRLAIVESVSKRMEPFWKLEYYLALLAGLSLLLGVGLGVVFAQPIAWPLVRLARAAQELGEGDYESLHRLQVNLPRQFESEDEIGILCRAFVEMGTGMKQRMAMAKYLSHGASESLQRSGSGQIPSQRRWMAILFSDIRGFTHFSEGRDPELIIERLNQVLGLQADIVQKYSGDVDKFVGDAMIAWFTGPDRCLRAVATVREIFTELATHTGNRQGGTLGAGLHVGEVVVGSMGSQDRREYTAIGSAVNLAERLCAAAQANQLLISQAVVTELEDQVPVRELPAIQVKGFAEPVAVYEVLLLEAEAVNAGSPVASSYAVA
jgi:class 3 adenylate cyclase